MVNLGRNRRFNGTIPNTFENCGHLEGIVLNRNQLEGEVPSSLSKCLSLRLLDLGYNHLNGTFPGWLGDDLTNLQVLILKSNDLHGPVVTSSTTELPFPSLIILDLSDNGFVGHLPGNYFQDFNAMKKGIKKDKITRDDPYYFIVMVNGMNLDFLQIFFDFSVIDLSNNEFERGIPDSIGSLNSLQVLNLSHNNLIDRIPYALGKLSNIEALDLSWNQLNGEIPQSLLDLTSLAILNLSQNRLVGCIPEGGQFSTFMGDSYGGNLNLCGLPLPNKCEHLHEPQLEADGETESEFTWRPVMLGCGCGTLLGLVMGYLMLSTGRPKWFNSIVDTTEHKIQTRRNKRS